MKTANSDFPTVSLSSLKRYMNATGWQKTVVPSGIEVFTKLVSDDEIEIALPGSSSARDLSERIADALETLIAVEQRPQDEISAAIRAVGYDLIRSRLPDSEIRRGSVRLSAADAFIRRMGRLLAASAHAELHSGPYFQRLSNVAQRYADDCRFGHTFPGSFGFSIESPVGPHSRDTMSTEEAPPLERRAVQRLARGLRSVEIAIAREDPSQIVNGYALGLNANACEELTALVESPHVREVNFQFVFSPEWPIPADLLQEVRTTIRCDQGSEILREAAKALRVVNIEKQRAIIGKVRTLHSMETPADLFNIEGLQDVVIEWQSEEFGRRNVRVSLGPEDYLRAVQAHTLGRTVSVFGELEQGGRQLRLENARDFHEL